MTDTKDDNGACRMLETDSEGNTNLCCCYTVDANGNYEDPCIVPVKECCSERYPMGTESH